MHDIVIYHLQEVVHETMMTLPERGHVTVSKWKSRRCAMHHSLPLDHHHILSNYYLQPAFNSKCAVGFKTWTWNNILCLNNSGIQH
jgi:hypothetical protein